MPSGSQVVAVGEVAQPCGVRRERPSGSHRSASGKCSPLKVADLADDGEAGVVVVLVRARRISLGRREERPLVADVRVDQLRHRQSRRTPLDRARPAELLQPAYCSTQRSSRREPNPVAPCVYSNASLGESPTLAMSRWAQRCVADEVLEEQRRRDRARAAGRVGGVGDHLLAAWTRTPREAAAARPARRDSWPASSSCSASTSSLANRAPSVVPERDLAGAGQGARCRRRRSRRCARPRTRGASASTSRPSASVLPTIDVRPP